MANICMCRCNSFDHIKVKFAAIKTKKSTMSCLLHLPGLNRKTEQLACGEWWPLRPTLKVSQDEEAINWCLYKPRLLDTLPYGSPTPPHQCQWPCICYILALQVGLDQHRFQYQYEYPYPVSILEGTSWCPNKIETGYWNNSRPGWNVGIQPKQIKYC